MHRAVEANGFVFVGGTIAEDTSVSMGEQIRNILDATWIEFFGDDLPTRATVSVADLGGGAFVEVVVTVLQGRA